MIILSVTNKRYRSISRVLLGAAIGAVMMAASSVSPGLAQGRDAKTVLKRMTDYVAAQKTISATFDTDIEVITPHLQKLQFTSSGQLTMSRPDKIRVARSGGYSDVELISDGATATILDKAENAYAQISAAGSIDQLVDRIRDEVGTAVPGADLLTTRAYDQLMDGVLEAYYIGQGVIDGFECDHLAFRNTETDWQIWIERGAQPIPRKYVITSKATAGAPQYTLRVKTWTTGAATAPDAFAFKAPAGAKKVEMKSLQNVDEVPAGTAAGEMK